MVRSTSLHLAALLGVAAFATAQPSFDWRLRRGFPAPVTPADNPMTAEKVELGRHLFYDTRLSGNGQQSCGSFHRQELAFTDGLARAKGSRGEIHPWSSMSLVNVAYAAALTRSDPNAVELESQALTPMFGAQPVELGLQGQEERVLRDLRGPTVYQRLFPAAFPGDAQPFRVGNVAKALAAFQRTIISTRSSCNRYRYEGDEGALFAAAMRGEKLFFPGEKAGCFQGHGGWNFGGAVRYAGGPPVKPDSHITGLGSHTAKAEDVGKFRAPTLRNIAITAPYMHDGSIATLEAVIGHYFVGGRSGLQPHRSPILRPLQFAVAEKQELIEFAGATPGSGLGAAD